MRLLGSRASIATTRARGRASGHGCTRRIPAGDGSILVLLCVRLIDSCMTQLKAVGPSRSCNESKEEEDIPKKSESVGAWLHTSNSSGGWLHSGTVGFFFIALEPRVEGYKGL